MQSYFAASSFLQDSYPIFSISASIATVAAALFAAFEFRRKSKSSKIELEEKFDSHRAVAKKLYISVNENRDIGPNTNTPSITIDITNHADIKFYNLIVHIPEVDVESVTFATGTVPSDEDYELYRMAPDQYDDPRQWRDYYPRERLQVSFLKTTWHIAEIKPGGIFEINIKFPEAYDWNLWEGFDPGYLAEPTQPRYVTDVIYDDGVNTWYYAYGLPSSLARIWPSWNPELMQIGAKKRVRGPIRANHRPRSSD